MLSLHQTFTYRKTILFTKQKNVWRIRALHNTRLLDPARPERRTTAVCDRSG